LHFVCRTFAGSKLGFKDIHGKIKKKRM